MPQPTGVADLHPTIFGFPTLKGLLTDPMAPANVLWFLTSLGLLQHSYDLLLGEPALLQISSSIQHILLGGLSFHMVLFPGGTSHTPANGVFNQCRKDANGFTGCRSPGRSCELGAPLGGHGAAPVLPHRSSRRPPFQVRRDIDFPGFPQKRLIPRSPGAAFPPPIEPG